MLDSFSQHTFLKLFFMAEQPIVWWYPITSLIKYYPCNRVHKFYLNMKAIALSQFWVNDFNVEFDAISVSSFF